jgi:hypothetical protein
MEYRKIPVKIQAVQWTGENVHALKDFAGDSITIEVSENRFVLHVNTLEGDMYAAPGSYIIRGVAGEFYPCKAEIFEQTYERV